MCRLYRIGQEQNVEFVKIIVKNTIDDYLVNIQNRKTAEIDGTLADEVLRQRQTVTELLDLFGAVPDSHSGGFILIPEHERREDQGVEELD